MINPYFLAGVFIDTIVAVLASCLGEGRNRLNSVKPDHSLKLKAIQIIKNEGLYCFQAEKKFYCFKFPDNKFFEVILKTVQKGEILNVFGYFWLGPSYGSNRTDWHLNSVQTNDLGWVKLFDPLTGCKQMTDT